MSSYNSSSSRTSSRKPPMEVNDPIVMMFRNRIHNDDEQSNGTMIVPIRSVAPIVSSYNDRIRPLLDAIDKLRHLKIMQEGIQLPTIVVVGDQSSGKSSVLESLAGISLPRGQGICTRVPLIMRLQNHEFPEPELYLEYNGKTVPTNEEKISDAISLATDEIAGNGKGISSNPLTLVVKKNGVPDLTMVDLPGITRNPVHGQPEDIYDQISKTIMEFITPDESIILNVLQASVDFSTCESISMSKRVDKTGERTLAVVTKVDKTPEGLLEKVTGDDVNIGLGYVCVRNRIGDETYEEARGEEADLFRNHRLLSRIDKSMVGIPVLAERLVKIQATIIVKCLPDIVRKINDKLAASVNDLNELPKHMSSIAEAMRTFMCILGSARESLRKVLLQGEFDDLDSVEKPCTAKMADMLNEYFDELKSNGNSEKGFLLDEIKVLEECKAIGLPNFLPKAAFLTLLQKKVKGISQIPVAFVEKMWNYIEIEVVSSLMKHVDNYPQLRSTIRRAAQNLVSKKKQQSVEWVNDIVEMEKDTNYTCCPEYTATWSKLMAYEGPFMKMLSEIRMCYEIDIEGLGTVNIEHLRGKKCIAKEAFDLKMRMTAYWTIVLQRLVDSTALHLVCNVQKLVNKEMELEISNEVIGVQSNVLDRMLEESPSVAEKRKRLNNSIKLLKESKDVVASIMDRVVSDFD